jgi:hypothetical protein
MMNTEHRFRAVIEDAGEGGAYVVIPFDVEQTFGKKRVKVRALLGGQPYRGSVVRMGTDCHVLGVRKDIREKVGKSIGDEIDVVLTEDTDARVVDVPADLRAALTPNARARATFEALSFTHQKTYVDWIESAKREATRRDRVARAVALLAEGIKRPGAAES